jgi:hypothetical protein
MTKATQAAIARGPDLPVIGPFNRLYGLIVLPHCNPCANRGTVHRSPHP